MNGDLMLEDGLEEMEDFEDLEDFEDPFLEDEEDEEALFEGGGDFEEFEDYEAGDLEEMEYLAEMAAEAESDAEADAFIGALIPLAAQLLPKAISIGRKVLPGLIKGAVRVGRRLRRSPTARRLVRTIPTLARRTARTLASRVASGKPVNARVATRVLAGHTARMLRDPRAVRRCLRICRMRSRRARRPRRRVA